METCDNLLLWNNFNDPLTYLSFLVLNLLNLLFYISFHWKWAASCYVFVNGQYIKSSWTTLA